MVQFRNKLNFLGDKMIQLSRSCIIVFIMVSSASLISLMYCTYNGYLTHFDYTALRAFYQLKSVILNHFFLTITWLGSLWILLPLSIAMLIFLPYRFKNFKIVFAVGFLSTIVVTHTLKNSVERPRPSFFDTLIDMPLDFSFPSAHTAQITAFTFLVWVLFFRESSLKSILFSSILLLIAITVASSRLYLQVHFLTDVLAGFLVAILCCFTALLTIKSN